MLLYVESDHRLMFYVRHVMITRISMMIDRLSPPSCSCLQLNAGSADQLDILVEIDAHVLLSPRLAEL